jgi:hypothetical protein
METWLPVKDFNDYEVSNYGRVRSLKTNTIMKSYTTKNGYQQIKLFSKSKHHPRYIHRLVAAAFFDCDYEEFEINHIDGDKENNFIGNLEWCKHSENTRHAIKTGLFIPYRLPPRPHPSKKVRILETGEIFQSITECAEYIGGHKSAISACLLGKVKSHLGYRFEEVD